MERRANGRKNQNKINNTYITKVEQGVREIYTSVWLSVSVRKGWPEKGATQSQRVLPVNVISACALTRVGLSILKGDLYIYPPFNSWPGPTNSYPLSSYSNPFFTFLDFIQNLFQYPSSNPRLHGQKTMSSNFITLNYLFSLGLYLLQLVLITREENNIFLFSFLSF